MPIKVTNENNNGYKLFSQLGLKSYAKYLDPTSLDTFYIVAPQDELLSLQALTRSVKLPFAYISEETLLENVDNEKGWFKQQLIKLAASSIVKTEHYLVLDADLYLTCPLSYDDLFENGKIKYNSEKYQRENSKYYSQNSNWWASSCNLLRCSTLMLEGKMVMSVTPEVIVTTIAQDLVQGMKDKYVDWQKTLCHEKFTEFTLYWVYVLLKDKQDLYTDKGFPLWKHHLDCNILHPEHLSIHNIRRSFTTPPSYFGVIQGYLNINVDEYIKIGLQFLHRKEIDAIFLSASMLSPNRFQSFTTQERYTQTIGTVQSVKERVLNSLCIIVDGSNVPEEYQEGFKNHYDIYLNLGADPEIINYVNHPSNIGHGECKLLEKGIQFIKETILPIYNPKYIFKLGARYCLNKDFDINRFDPNKFNFRMHHDECVNLDVYTTGLYSIPVKYIDLFEDILVNSQNVLSKDVTMVERLYRVMVPLELTHLVETLGLQGELSYNRHFFAV